MKAKILGLLATLATMAIFSFCFLLFILQFAELASGPSVPSAVSKRSLLKPSSFNPQNQEPRAQANRVALDSLSWGQQ